MEREQFKVLVKAMKAVYAQPTFIPDQDAFNVWFALLGDLPYKQAELAVQKHMATEKFPPTILILVGAFFVWFNWQMILVFREYGSMPETYACAVVAATIGECGICGWIRTNKDKRLDRKWQKEDEKESQEQYVPDINVGNKNEEENL